MKTIILPIKDPKASKLSFGYIFSSANSTVRHIRYLDQTWYTDEILLKLRGGRPTALVGDYYIVGSNTRFYHKDDFRRALYPILTAEFLEAARV